MAHGMIKVGSVKVNQPHMKLTTKKNVKQKDSFTSVMIVSSSPHDGEGVYTNRWRRLVLKIDGQSIDNRKVLRFKRDKDGTGWCDLVVRKENGLIKTDRHGVPFYDRKENVQIGIDTLPKIVTCSKCVAKDKIRSKKENFWKSIFGTLVKS